MILNPYYYLVLPVGISGLYTWEAWKRRVEKKGLTRREVSQFITYYLGIWEAQMKSGILSLSARVVIEKLMLKVGQLGILTKHNPN